MSEKIFADRVRSRERPRKERAEHRGEDAALCEGQEAQDWDPRQHLGSKRTR